MKLKTFFEKFDQFADAPDAVAKMRELVLNLAVQGKLVCQDSRDEGVGDLLGRNDKTRGSMAQSDRRADRDNQSLLSAEDRCMIPDSWSWRALADLVLFVDYRGKTPTKLDDGVRLITAKNVRKGAINLSPEEFLSEKDYHAWMTRGFPKVGDILFTTEAPMGNAAVVKLEGRFALAQRVICFQSYGAIDSSYLVLLILTTQFQFILDKNGTGVTAKGIKASKLKQLPIAVPPLAEQKRIVAKVDELMALCDRLEAQQQERDEQTSALARASLARFAEAPTPAHLNLLFHKSYSITPADLRKAILTVAVQGKLIRFESQHAGKTVGDHIEFLNGYAFKSEWFKPSGVRLCRNANVSHGVIDWRESVFVDDDIAKEFERFVLREGDIVLSLDRPLITTGLKVARVQKSDLPCLLLQRVAKPVPKHDQLDLSFFLLWLNSSEFVDTIDPGRSNGVPHISTRQVQILPFTLPPLAEQRRIVAKVDQLMALVDQLETQLAASRATAKNLLEAVVARLTNLS